MIWCEKKAINKGFTFQDYKKAAALLKKHKIERENLRAPETTVLDRERITQRLHQNSQRHRPIYGSALIEPDKHTASHRGGIPLETKSVQATMALEHR